MDAVHPGGLGGTYGGNPIACAAALAAIETMRELDLAAAARRIESALRPGLEALAARHPVTTARVALACHEAGLLVLTCGTYGNVLRFLPPLVISDEQLGRGLEILGAAFAAA